MITKKNIPCKKLKEMIQEEKMGAREYKKYGLNSFAEDEERHSRKLSQMHSAKCGRSKNGKM